MIGSIGSALSGLQAAQTRLDATAQNVANVDTDGYRRQAVLHPERAVECSSPRNPSTWISRAPRPAIDGPAFADPRWVAAAAAA